MLVVGWRMLAVDLEQRFVESNGTQPVAWRDRLPLDGDGTNRVRHGTAGAAD
jgi:hypothetical protein